MSAKRKSYPWQGRETKGLSPHEDRNASRPPALWWSLYLFSPTVTAAHPHHDGYTTRLIQLGGAFVELPRPFLSDPGKTQKTCLLRRDQHQKHEACYVLPPENNKNRLATCLCWADAERPGTELTRASLTNPLTSSCSFTPY